MSIAVAVQKQGRIVLATDSQTNFGSHREGAPNYHCVKSLQVGEAWVATTGWGLYANILEDYCERRKAALTDERAIFRFFMRFWSDLHERYPFVNDQCQKDDPTPFGDLDADFLIINPQGIFQVSSDMSVIELRQYGTIGSGSDYASGVLWSRYEDEDDPAALARQAVQAAIHFNIHCGGEVQMREVAARTLKRKPQTRPARKAKS